MDNKCSILLVDDDKFLLEMYRKKFEESGATVTVAVGSEEALAQLREGTSFELVVLDVIMPTMDGLELLAVIRKEGLASKAKIVMLTNESDPEKIQKAKAIGIDGYIVKATRIPSEVVEETFKIANIKLNKSA